MQDFSMFQSVSNCSKPILQCHNMTRSTSDSSDYYVPIVLEVSTVYSIYSNQSVTVKLDKKCWFQKSYCYMLFLYFLEKFHQTVLSIFHIFSYFVTFLVWTRYTLRTCFDLINRIRDTDNMSDNSWCQLHVCCLITKPPPVQTLPFALCHFNDPMPMFWQVLLHVLYYIYITTKNIVCQYCMLFC